LLEKTAGLPLTVDASRIMMCGNPDMIEDMRRLLHQRGMRPCRRMLPGQFVTENYW
jgi:ferredoxin/flavodoxin---NADP+ reductase